MCNHDINQSDCTIVLSPKKIFVAPEQCFGYCTECECSFTYIKEQNKWRLVDNDDGIRFNG